MNKHSLIAALLVGTSAAAQPTERILNQYESSHFYESGDTLPYRILQPKVEGAFAKYPLVLFLHGAGERGKDNTAQLSHGGALFADGIGSYPAIVVFPQCGPDDYWPLVDVAMTDQVRTFAFPQKEAMNPGLRMVSLLLDDLMRRSDVDTSRVYIAGLSMGAMGTYELVSRRPDTFAAAIAICGGGNAEAAAKYARRTPFWIFHGKEDEVVPASHSIAMEKAIKNAGGHPKLTLYEGVNHNSWDNAFAEPDLLNWLFSQSK